MSTSCCSTPAGADSGRVKCTSGDTIPRKNSTSENEAVSESPGSVLQQCFEWVSQALRCFRRCAFASKNTAKPQEWRGIDSGAPHKCQEPCWIFTSWTAAADHSDCKTTGAPLGAPEERSAPRRLLFCIIVGSVCHHPSYSTAMVGFH